ncbi:hypothetical protein SAMD00079811_81850 (plasmid) [Scytonema sp. HK-05]|uniref:hypothetical protein n=1 Tax=Scytonema sp. HK-05 TaxID=1137095 RepID=UPI000935AB69|nr:hypothetical protein [Scytonema sp. HK-05]OKH58145.1 hypothetical protein NIES2130_15750 [Scytonema sp. HK-05]BAY50556.1 hypothetical protein SAMD00079811_81850 [Scytonema sp. HK-05]
MNRRPIGVTILASLQLINSLSLLLQGVVVLFFKKSNLHQLLHTPVLPNNIADYIGGFLLFCSLISFLLAYGLFGLKFWAWLISLIFQILALVAFFFVFSQVRTTAGLTVISAVIHVVIIYYLFQPNVRRSFAPAS